MSASRQYRHNFHEADQTGPPTRLDSSRWPALFPNPWTMELQRLRGGKREGVELLTVDNGLFSFDILPTRGMGLWQGRLGNLRLGWDSPIHGPVHPSFVNLVDRGGLGWLDGFDEWLCRCGLSSLGPPCNDPKTGEVLTLHGRIANQPAHHLEARIQLAPPFALEIIGHVEESTPLLAGWELRTTYRTFPGSNRLVVADEIVNLRQRPQELYLLYHINFGPPLLGPGSRVEIPHTSIEPRDERAKEGLATWHSYEPPRPGYAEQVYVFRPQADADGHAWARLQDPAGKNACRLIWKVAELPYFCLWKNSMPESDGYVTGLEPATCFPLTRPQERDAGRAILVPPGVSYRCGLTIEVLCAS
jgi:hypothetical protein